MQPPDAQGFTRFPAINCPYCGKTLNATGRLDGEPVGPEDGDVSLCFDCSEPSVVVVTALGIGIRKPTPEERAEFFLDYGPDIEKMIEFNIAFPCRLKDGGH